MRLERVGGAGVPHAGEGDGPASVRSAIEDLHAERIGHGVRAIEDPDLATLAERTRSGPDAPAVSDVPRNSCHQATESVAW